MGLGAFNAMRARQREEAFALARHANQALSKNAPPENDDAATSKPKTEGLLGAIDGNGAKRRKGK